MGIFLNKKNLIIALVIFLIALVVVILVISTRKPDLNISPFTQDEVSFPTPRRDTDTKLDIKMPNTSPSVKDGLTRPWGTIERQKIFKIDQIDNSCVPNQIIAEKDEELELIFEGNAKFFDPGIEQQEGLEKITTTVETIYKFKATKPGAYSFACSKHSIDPDNPKGELVIK